MNISSHCRYLRLALVLVLTAPSFVWAQTEGPRWDLSVSASGGGAIPFSTSVVQEDRPQIFRFEDADLDNSATFGGKITAWMKRGQGATVEPGFQLDVTHFSPDIGTQALKTTPMAGSPPASPLTFNALDLSATLVTANLLLRLPRGVSDQLPHGRWYPYLGIGVGPSMTSATRTDGTEDEDLATVLQALCGLKVFLTNSIGLFGEYKFTHVRHTFKFGTLENRFDLSTNHLVGGVAFHF